MSYRDRFRSWRNEDTVQAHPYITFYKPETMYSLDDIQRRDRYAAADIDTLQTMIADLQEYRQDLAARYAEIATTTYTYRLYIVREKSWCTKKVSYTVRLARVLPCGKRFKALLTSFQNWTRSSTKPWKRSRECVKPTATGTAGVVGRRAWTRLRRQAVLKAANIGGRRVFMSALSKRAPKKTLSENSAASLPKSDFGKIDGRF